MASICTCCTSFVFLVMRDPGPKADVSSCAHRGHRREVGGDDRGHDLAERDDEHQRAGVPDVVGVALGDAVVDDVGVETGQEEAGEGRSELEDQDADEKPFVRLQ
jgi:hypothetical protein